MSSSNFSYPHPILGNNDDIDIELCKKLSIDGLEQTEENIHRYQFKITLDDPTILELIKEHKAKYGINIKCRRTLYQDKILSDSNIIDIRIPRDRVLERIDFETFVIATDNFVYTNPKANPMFLGASFDIHPGDPLVFFPYVYDKLEVTFHTLKHYSAILVPVPDDNVADNDIQIVTNEKIEVHLSPQTYAIFKDVNTENNAPEIISSIVQTALTTALFKLFLDFDGGDSLPDAEDIRKNDNAWVQAIVARMNEEGMPTIDEVCDSPFSEIPSLVQKLLKFPISTLLDKLQNKTDIVANSTESI